MFRSLNTVLIGAVPQPFEMHEANVNLFPWQMKPFGTHGYAGAQGQKPHVVGSFPPAVRAGGDLELCRWWWEAAPASLRHSVETGGPGLTSPATPWLQPRSPSSQPPTHIPPTQMTSTLTQIVLVLLAHGPRAICEGSGGRDGEMRGRGDPISQGVSETHHEVSGVPAADVKE